MGQLDDVGKAVPAVLPKIRFATREIEHPDAFGKEAVEHSLDFVHAHALVIDVGNPAIDAMQVASIVGYQAEDIWSVAVQDKEIKAESNIAQRPLHHCVHNSILPGHASRIDRVQTLSM